MRVTVKKLEERIQTINGLLNEKISLFITTGCGVDLRINDEYVSDKLGYETLTNKQAMEYLDKEYNNKIRKIMLESKGE